MPKMPTKPRIRKLVGTLGFLGIFGFLKKVFSAIIQMKTHSSHPAMNTLLLHAYFFASKASAQVFNGTGLEGGVNAAAQINGPLHVSLREIILSFLYKALGFLALAGVLMVIAAGFYLVLSAGSETAKDKAKTMILCVVIGIVIIFLARSLVGFFLYGLPA